MRTYVLEVDGKRQLAFRAKDDADATDTAKSSWGSSGTIKINAGLLTVRLATIPERVLWQAESVEMTEENPETPADSVVMHLGE